MCIESGMDFKKYLTELGDDEASTRYKTKPRTVASWRRGERVPRPEKARLIVRIEQGKISLSDIYGEAA